MIPFLEYPVTQTQCQPQPHVHQRICKYMLKKAGSVDKAIPISHLWKKKNIYFFPIFHETGRVMSQDKNERPALKGTPASGKCFIYAFITGSNGHQCWIFTHLGATIVTSIVSNGSELCQSSKNKQLSKYDLIELGGKRYFFFSKIGAKCVCVLCHLIVETLQKG